MVFLLKRDGENVSKYCIVENAEYIAQNRIRITINGINFNDNIGDSYTLKNSGVKDEVRAATCSISNIIKDKNKLKSFIYLVINDTTDEDKIKEYITFLRNDLKKNGFVLN